jgi:hypothetical protein
MTNVEAIQLLTNVCAGVQGNLKDHQLIQEALNIIRSLAFPVYAPKPKEIVGPTEKPETIKPDFGKKETETEDSK